MARIPAGTVLTLPRLIAFPDGIHRQCFTRTPDRVVADRMVWRGEDGTVVVLPAWVRRMGTTTRPTKGA